MRSTILRSLLLAAVLCLPAGGHGAAAAAPAKAAPERHPVWEAMLPDFSDGAYRYAVEQMLQGFERASGRELRPGAKGKVGLKIYTDSGPGLATPVPLVRAVIAALERRGYAKENIFLVGLNPLRLRMTGYLPSYSTGEAALPGHPLYVLESGKFYDPAWFYDSPLPARFDPVLNERAAEAAAGGRAETSKDEDRKSFLATPLFFDADFWINLPVYSDHPVLGVNGALVNATLWNASNTFRFFRSPATAPAAVAEMAAIPELRESWILTIVSLQLYQFIGGPYFNSLYSVSEPRVWLSADPVVLDALMAERINEARRRTGFLPLPEEGVRLLEFAEQLQVGSRSTGDVPWRRIN